MPAERLPDQYVKDARGDLIPDSVQRNFEYLARRGSGRPAWVSALPPSPRDGAEVYFHNGLVMPDGVVWHLRYRSAITGSYKWEYIGGAALTDSASGNVNLSTAGSNVILTSDIGITVPLAGDYSFEMMTAAAHSGNNQGIHLFPHGAGFTGFGGSQGSSYCCQPAGAANASFPMSGNGVLSNLTAGGTVSLGYFVGVTGGQLLQRRFMCMTPRKVG